MTAAARGLLAAFSAFAALMIAAAPASADDSLRAIICAAEEHSPLIKAAAARIDGAKADLAGAKAKSRPRLTAGFSAAHFDDAELFPAFGPDGRQSGFVKTRWRDVCRASAAFEQTIYSGGGIEAGIRAGAFAVDAARAEAERVYQSVIDGARRAWYACRRAQAHVGVAREALELAKEHHARAEALRRAGVAPPGDVLRAKVAVSQGRLDLISAENALDTAWAALERVTACELDRDALLPPLPPLRSLASSDPAGGGIDGAELETALSRRAELRAVAAQTDRAREMLRAASSLRLPRAAISAGVSVADDRLLPKERDEAFIAIGAEWTIFDGGEARARELRAKAAARELIYEAEDLAAMIKEEVIRAELGIRSAAARLAVARDQIASAEEDHRIAARRYSANVGTNIDVLDAAVALTSSRAALVDAVFDAEEARSAMLLATGADEPPAGLFEPAAAAAQN